MKVVAPSTGVESDQKADGSVAEVREECVITVIWEDRADREVFMETKERLFDGKMP